MTSEKRPFSVFPTGKAPREFIFQANFTRGAMYAWKFLDEHGKFVALIRPSSGPGRSTCAKVVYAFPYDGVFSVKLISMYDDAQVIVERVAEVDSSRGLVGYGDTPDDSRRRVDENLREVFG